MSPDELRDLLDDLIDGWENEVVEFKEAAHQFSADKTGEYVSALSNEANLRGADSGWLVFGVSNSRTATGTTHLDNVAKRQSLKHHVQQSIDQGLTIREIHEVDVDGKRVVLLEIPAAPQGIPISWKGDYRARAGESLVPLSLDKQDEIRQQTINLDWSAEILPDATLDHLDPAAILRARQGFAERYPRLAEQIEHWDDVTFLEKARITLNGGITRTAILLLGKYTSWHLLSPHPAEMTWKLTGPESAYEHFHTPFLLNATALAKRIRNIQLRLLPPDELIYREISKYDERSLLEAIYNCVAHQDYRQRSRVIVVEHVDRVEFISVGEFFDLSPEDYMLSERVPRKYRNPFLVTAMTELNLIDHLGNGIHRIVADQRRRFLPMPDYDLSEPTEVKLTIHGAVIDEAFSQQMMVHSDLPLEDVLALDRVQKGMPISKEAVARLRRAHLIEGRSPKLHVSSAVAAAAEAAASYVRTRAQSDEFYAKLVLDYLAVAGEATRQDINDLLWDKLSDALVEKQKQNKVMNLLTKMRQAGQIRNAGTRAQSRWVLS
ncbi:RNA-binding domain-containing protein [Nocardioides sp. AE5]|uniref:RNA-binding domain-containing protein n=1 Tax=Nocardioides sp. AE5 TaxID=2962573 RepID=UPI0028815787|nr:RNA-binding domain-containing protein [Nocardioides sp. AE5]MDT0202398.1 putative DNA binding domain-containing protein [Nocardioides sp. AE5]